MRVLGLDPGLRHTGWGVIDVAGNRLSYVADGVVHAPTDLPLAERLVALFRQIIEVLDRFRPDEAAVEETFVNKNPASTLKLGVARGVVLLAPAERGLRVAEYSATRRPRSAGASNTTPRATPSFKVEAGFLLTKVSSTAASSGRKRSMMLINWRNSATSRSAKGRSVGACTTPSAT